MLLLQQMVVLFLLMGVGFYCYKKSMITDEVSKKLSAIVVNIANPAMVLTGSMSDDKIHGSELILTAVVMVGIYATLLILAQILPRLLRIEKKSRGNLINLSVSKENYFLIYLWLKTQLTFSK